MKRIIMGLICLSLTACGMPKYASEKEISEYLSAHIAEPIEYVETSAEDKHSYIYRAMDRDFTFRVWSNAEAAANIDGANFGYSGEYSINTDYDEHSCGYYSERIAELADSCGFEITDTCDNDAFPCYRYFWFKIDGINDDEREIRSRIPQFLKGVQEIAAEESTYHVQGAGYTTSDTAFGEFRYRISMNSCECTDKQWRAFSDTEHFERWQTVTADSFTDPESLMLEMGCLSDTPSAYYRHTVILETKDE
ncbi:MAG: hypothetical protein II695_10520 [Oscillospiraceae bacterium]|nr:hypothetical protein [Oscillospiraceae bacterium]